MPREIVQIDDSVQCRQAKGWDCVDAFAFQVQRHAAGDQQRQLRRLAREADEIGAASTCSKLSRTRGTCVRPCAGPGHHRGPASLLTTPSTHATADATNCGSRTAASGDKVDAVRRGGHAARGRAPQDVTCRCRRDRPALRGELHQQLLHLLQFSIAADELGGLGREVVVRDKADAQRPELAEQTLGVRLKQPQGRRMIGVDVVLAQFGQNDSRQR